MRSPRRVIAKRMSLTRILVLVMSCLCFIVCAIVLMNLQTPTGAYRWDAVPAPEPVVTRQPEPRSTDSAVKSEAPQPTDSPTPPAEKGEPSVSSPGSSPASTATPIADTDLVYLMTRKLLIPVEGVKPGMLHDSFYDGRSEGRIHQALDIMAPQGAPVLAASDGMAVKLHTSDRGGIMLYESDPSGLYVYYYGHLQRYADGMYEHKPLKRGEVIGYVGDTGNAGPGNYHLHFGISKVSAPGKWSGGQPINPFPLLAAR